MPPCMLSKLDWPTCFAWLLCPMIARHCATLACCCAQHLRTHLRAHAPCASGLAPMSPHICKMLCALPVHALMFVVIVLPRACPTTHAYCRVPAYALDLPCFHARHKHTYVTAKTWNKAIIQATSLGPPGLRC